MKVQYLGVAALNSDAGICDAARVSFDKVAADYSEEQNQKLLGYLFTHKHWSPFGHAREAFYIDMDYKQFSIFAGLANLTGFSWTPGVYKVISGSLWAWYENLHALPGDAADYIIRFLETKYPLCSFLYNLEVESEHTNDECFVALPEPEMLSPHTVSVSFRIQAPIFVARQLVKHQRHLCWNEESRRYISTEPTFWKPRAWRSRPVNAKQGSSGLLSQKQQTLAQEEFASGTTAAFEAYLQMLELGTAPEMARAVLPLSSNTSWVWTGTVDAFARVARERLAPGAQAETAEVVERMDHFLRNDPMTKELYIV